MVIASTISSINGVPYLCELTFSNILLLNVKREASRSGQRSSHHEQAPAEPAAAAIQAANEVPEPGACRAGDPRAVVPTRPRNAGRGEGRPAFPPRGRARRRP